MAVIEDIELIYSQTQTFKSLIEKLIDNTEKILGENELNNNLNDAQYAALNFACDHLTVAEDCLEQSNNFLKMVINPSSNELSYDGEISAN